MRVLLIPTVLVGVLAVTGSDEPTESAMRAAFQTTQALGEQLLCPPVLT